MIVGYARVSTQDQDLTAQLEHLHAAGVQKIFKEKISGAQTDRPELAKLMKTLQPGDTLIVTRLDRLAPFAYPQEIALKIISSSLWAWVAP